MATDDGSKPYHEPSIPFAQQQSEVRAQFSRSVGDQLDHSQGMWRYSPSRERPVQFYLRENFLEPGECAGLVERIDAGTYPSPLYDKDNYADVRTSHSCNLDVYDPLVATIDRRIAALLGLDPALGEPLQGQRYAEGQEFKDHADFFYVDQPYWPEYAAHGGQRTWTAMIYLDSPKTGGGTSFPLVNLDITPLPGRILVWNNMALDGSPNPWTLHCGRPVEIGVKYIVTKWYREQPFV